MGEVNRGAVCAQGRLDVEAIASSLVLDAPVAQRALANLNSCLESVVVVRCCERETGSKAQFAPVLQQRQAKAADCSAFAIGTAQLERGESLRKPNAASGGVAFRAWELLLGEVSPEWCSDTDS